MESPVEESPVATSQAVEAITDPSFERQQTLDKAYRENLAKGLPPYDHIAVHSSSELAWVLRQRGWSGEPLANDAARADLRGVYLAQVDLHDCALFRANLSDANLDSAILSNADLFQANLSGAVLIRATLTGANLFQANLSGADLYQAHLGKANLFLANLSGAFLRSTDAPGAFFYQAILRGATAFHANFAGADFEGAVLSAADFSYADLRGADLVGAHLDADTKLSGVQFDTLTSLRDVAWNGAPLGNIDWSQALILGDETRLVNQRIRRRKRRSQAYRQAARSYRGTSLALRAQGLIEVVSTYHKREQRMLRKALFTEHKYNEWVFSWLLNLVAGYGEEPVRSLFAYITTIVLFAAAYMGISHLSWDQALVLSLISFHGRGLFPGTLHLNVWIIRLAALEAVIGLFIELVFIATFSRRFLGG